MKRIDELNKYYKPIGIIDKCAKILFWICSIISILIFSLKGDTSNWLQQSSDIGFIISVLTYSILSNYNSFFLIPSVEKIRRKQLISDALKVPLTPEITKNYYNNELFPSITRLGVCVLENTYFAKKVCKEMLKFERIRVFIYFILWFIVVCIRQVDTGLLIILTQILFSGEVIFYWLRLELLCHKNEVIHESLYNHFLSYKTTIDDVKTAKILDCFVSYECAKSNASIKQSSKIFDKINPQLSSEWESIKEKLNITN